MIAKVRAALEQRGWVKNRFENANGVCLLGAIGLAVHGDAQRYTALSNDPELRLVAKVIREQFRDRVLAQTDWRSPRASAGWICTFNDDEVTEDYEVFAVLEKAEAEE